MSELVTGDAVVLGLRPARVPSRALAIFIDLLLVWSLYIALSVLILTSVSSLDTAAMAAVQVALFVLVPVGVPIAVETLSRGRSVGKLACGLRVVREDGGPVRFRHALVRGAIGVVEIQLSSGVIACLASLVSSRGRRLGDVFAGTLVVRERVPSVRAEQAPPPPPWLAGRFSELDLSRVPEPLWLAIRQYLMRSSQLDEAVSHTMAGKLATDFAAYTGAPPPPDVPPGAFLAGVLAERQGRDARRAFGSGHSGFAAPGWTGSPPAHAGPDGGPGPHTGGQGTGEPASAPAGKPPAEAAPAGEASPGETSPGQTPARRPGGFVPPA